MSERGKPGPPPIRHPKYGTCLACRQGVRLSSSDGAPTTHHVKRVVRGGDALESQVCRGSGRQGAYEEYENLARIQHARARGEEPE